MDPGWVGFRCCGGENIHSLHTREGGLARGWGYSPCRSSIRQTYSQHPRVSPFRSTKSAPHNPITHHQTTLPLPKHPPSTAQSPNKPNRRSTSTASPRLTCHPNLTRGPKHLVHSQREYLPSPTRDPIRTWKGTPQPRIPPRKKSKPDRRRKTQNCDRCDSAICKCRRGPGDQSWGSEEEGRGGGETCVGSLEWVGR